MSAISQKYNITVEEIEGRIDLYQLVESYGTALNRQGQGHCPFHPDDTASLHIYPDHYHCFGCGAHGGAIKFIQLKEDTDFKTALGIAKSKAGLAGGSQATIADLDWRKPVAKPALDWTSPEWQSFAESQVAAAQARLTGKALELLKADRGLTEATIRHFELGWTGEKAIKCKVGDRFLFISARSWLIPCRNEDGKIQMLKWRSSLSKEEWAEAYPNKKYQKYGQVAGGTNLIYNLKAAKQQETIVLCTGEFEVMALRQQGHLEAACSTAGESSHVDIDSIFGTEKSVVYIADNDTRGKQFAREKQAKCERLKVAMPPSPHKDLGDLLKAGLLSYGFIQYFIAGAKARSIQGRRRKTQVVELAQEAEQVEKYVELEEARVELAQTASKRYAHPRKARVSTMQLAAAPGVGKGHAMNCYATEYAKELGKTTAWVSQRHDQYFDQLRPEELWKQVKGRSAAVDANGEPVDWNSPSAVGFGNCTVEGSAVANKLGEKGWAIEIHKYCSSCPVKKECEKTGYFSMLNKDGRNGHLTYEQAFTTIPTNYQQVVLDEPNYKNFLEITELTRMEIRHMRLFVTNGAMNLQLKALAAILRSLEETVFDFEGEANLDEIKSAFSVTGAKFLKQLDQACREHAGAGLLELVDRAEATDNVYGQDLWDLLNERSLDAAEKLPLNFWHIKGAEPGAGGLYDLIKEEAKLCLMSGDGSLPLWEGQEFVSRLELRREYKAKDGKIVLYRRRWLPYAVGEKPITATDGTGRPELLKELLSYWKNTAKIWDEEAKKHYPDHKNPVWVKFTRPVEVVAPKVAMPSCVRVIQDTRCNYSKTSLLQSYNKKTSYWQKYVEVVAGYISEAHANNQQSLVTCCKAVEPLLKKALKVELPEELELGRDYALEHYGNIRGSNQYQDWDVVIQAGMYMPEPQSIIGAARALYGGDGKDLNTEMARVTRVHNYSKNGKGLADEVLIFKDERCEALQRIEQEDEHMQAAYRIRPLSATTPKKIIMLFSLPIQGLRVDEMITSDGTETASTRTQTALDILVDTLKAECDPEKINPYVSAGQIAEKLAGKVARGTVYKHLAKAAELAGLKLYSIPYFQILKGGRGKEAREIRKDLQLVGHNGSLPKIISILIICRGLPIRGEYRLAPIEETEFAPDLPEISVSGPEEAPLKVRGEVATHLNYVQNQLLPAIAAEIASRQGEDSAKASLLRAEYQEHVTRINDLVKGK